MELIERPFYTLNMGNRKHCQSLETYYGCTCCDFATFNLSEAILHAQDWNGHQLLPREAD